MSFKLCIRPDGAICYYADRKRNSTTFVKKRFPHKSNMSPGQISPNARRKLLNAIKWLSLAATTKQVYEKKMKRVVDWKVNMLTFTFKENMQDDNKARALLSMWIEMAKYRFGLNSYVWKAEPQERGAIHFHMVTDIFVPHAELRYTWNRLLRKHGLNNITDNSTDVHACVNIKNLTAYLAEYLVNDKKHEGRREIKGKLWGCSHALSHAGKDYLLIKDDEMQELHSDMHQFHLANIIAEQGKLVPEFLRFIDIWKLPDNFFKQLPECEIKTLYLQELKKLQPEPKKKPQLFDNVPQ